jgi:hypothetical protein
VTDPTASDAIASENDGSIEDALGFGTGDPSVNEDPASTQSGAAGTASSSDETAVSNSGAGSGQVEAGTGAGKTASNNSMASRNTGVSSEDQLLDPDGLVDNTLTVIVGIIGGIIVGLVGTFALLIATGHGISLLLGFGAWLGSTAVLVRQRTVQGAVSKSAYSVAIVLIVIPFLLAISPTFDEGIGGRFGLFVATLIPLGIPALVAGGIGKFAGMYVPEDASGSEG